MNRWKAAAIHLSISMMLALIIAALLYFVWFPSPYFFAAGASTLMLLLMGVDVCIGPMLTLLVVNRSKAMRLIRLDLTIIGALQAIAFAYGLYVICQARPIFVVAEVDRLVLVAADEVSDADLAKGPAPAFRHRSWTGPVLVGAVPPTGDEVADIALQVARGGADIDRRPKFYVPYDQVIDAVLQRSVTLGELHAAGANEQVQLKRLANKHPGDTLVALPLTRAEADYTVVLSKHSRRPVALLNAAFWQE